MSTYHRDYPVVLILMARSTTPSLLPDAYDLNPRPTPRRLNLPDYGGPPAAKDLWACQPLQAVNIVPKDPGSPKSLPGQPRVDLQSPMLGDYLSSNFLTPTLNKLAPSWLWLVAKQDSSHVSPLQHQLVRGREIVITENPECMPFRYRLISGKQ